jgi:2-haloacid dehalogenase
VQWFLISAVSCSTGTRITCIRKLIADDHERQWFLDTICTQAWNTEQDAGRSLADATRSLIDEYPHHHALIQAYYDRWHEMLLGPLPEGVAILTALHQANMPLFGLTNWSAETFPYARANYPFLQIFATSWCPASEADQARRGDLSRQP